MGMTVRGTPESTVILHWDECRAAWAELSWVDWVRFRGLGEERSPSLAGAPAGEHYFVVCILGHRGELANVIPHKYVMSADGRLVHGFDGLGEEEREESSRIEQIAVPTLEESERYQELGDRGFAVNLPPQHTVPPLLRSMPGLAGVPPSAPCWHFLSAIGISSSGTRPH
jgi:hypothetical protein